MNWLPAPVFGTAKNEPQSVAPPLPPSVGLSIFDDQLGDTIDEDRLDLDQDKEVMMDDHPDDVLQGESLRTPENLNSGERANSFYLVYSSRSKLVKIGITLYTYEECFAKYTKLYGHLDAFQFLRIENGKIILIYFFFNGTYDDHISIYLSQT